VAEELQEQQLSMIQDRQRAQLELAQQMLNLQKSTSGSSGSSKPSKKKVHFRTRGNTDWS
jgi:hypothetical protein